MSRAQNSHFRHRQRSNIKYYEDVLCKTLKSNHPCNQYASRFEPHTISIAPCNASNLSDLVQNLNQSNDNVHTGIVQANPKWYVQHWNCKKNPFKVHLNLIHAFIRNTHCRSIWMRRKGCPAKTVRHRLWRLIVISAFRSVYN